MPDVYRAKQHHGKDVVKQYDTDGTVVKVIHSALIQCPEDAERLAKLMNEAYELGGIETMEGRKEQIADV